MWTGEAAKARPLPQRFATECKASVALPRLHPAGWRSVMSLTERNSEHLPARRQQKEKRQPVFVARARQADGKAWLTIGAAWERKEGEPGYSVKLNALPFNFGL